MTTKDQYYERRSSGLCTKCSNPLGNSPSRTRCEPCYEKHKIGKEKRKNLVKKTGNCENCGEMALLGDSDYCKECRTNDSIVLRENPSTEPLKFSDANNGCRVCNGLLDALGTLCQNCLRNSSFTKYDALSRYRLKCGYCNEVEAARLRFINGDNSALARKGPELYKYICTSPALPQEIILCCHDCYWKINLKYVMKVRQMHLERSKKFSESSDTNDIIDVNGAEAADVEGSEEV